VTLTWLIGRGLLGNAVLRRAIPGQVWRGASAIPWGDRADVEAWFQSAAAEFFEQSASQDWAVAWCAGTGVVGSSAATFELEVAAFESLLAAVGRSADTPGTVFLASSIGAIHGGNVSLPLDEGSVRVPISEYGVAKCAQEDLLSAWCRTTGHRGVIGRITNLYGPGQHLGKAQGLVSQICKSYLLRQPIVLYVSFETTRDYLFVDDAAEMVLSLLDGPPAGHDGLASIRILGSGIAVTLGGVLQVCEKVLRRQNRVITVQSALSNMQSPDLRVRPRMAIALPGGPTSLPVGVRRTFDDQLRQFQRGMLQTSVVVGV